MLSDVASVVAPLTVALTGMLYVAGWIYQYRLIVVFGMRPELFDYSLQDTLVRGYPPIMIGTLVMFNIVIGLSLLASLLPKRVIDFFLRYPTRNAFNRISLLVLAASFMLSYGFIAGAILGDLRARKVAKLVEAGCKVGCYTYFANDKAVTGLVIAQDKSRLALYTNAGTVLLKNDTLTRVVPLRPLSRSTVF